MYQQPAILWTDDGDKNKDKPPQGFEKFFKDKKPTE
jgi:hypothetical protein